ncbi:MAG: recombinase family protein [Oscillospiraceae bacterium]
MVSRIFSSATFGDNSRQIAQQLNAENIPSPSVYYFESNNKENTNKNKSTNWGSATIMAILRNAVYKGDMVQGKRKVVSFKLKKRIVTTPDDWIIVKNTHEPIISPDNWDKVQQILDKKKHYHSPKNNSREISTFAGLCKCADCGSSMAASPRGAKGKEKITYRCTTYVNKGKSSCFSHNVREEILTEIVLRDIHDFAVLAKNNKKNFINQIIKYISESTASKNADAEKQLSEVTDKINSLNTTVRTLYSDRVSGKMPESFFFSLLNDYKKELDELEVKIPALNEQVQSVFNKESDIGQWVENVLKYISIQHMNRMIALELIDKITVSDIHTDNKKREQDIIVYYKTVGDISALIKHNN